MAYDPDKAAARKARKEQAKKDIIRNEFIRRMMQDREGRNWIWEILARLHVGSSVFSSDPYVTAFTAGEQNAGLMLQAEVLRAAPHEYLTMQLEQANDDELKRAFGPAGDATDDTDGDDTEAG